MIKEFVLSMGAAVVFSACATSDDLTPGPDGIIRNPDGSIRRLTKEERKRVPKEVYSAMAKEFFRTEFGPQVEKPGSAKGYFKFVNCSGKVTTNDLEGAIKPITRVSKIRIEAVNAKAPELTEAKSSMSAYGANAAVFLVDSEVLPRIVLAPEDGWAFVNITALSSDSPRHEVLAKRVNLELVRAFSFICGSATDGRVAALGTVSKLKDLDDMPSPAFLPTNFKRMSSQLTAFGIAPRVLAPYKKACEEGWAYSPTNEIEKAIWDKVHTAPSKPIKIKYDPKAGK